MLSRITAASLFCSMSATLVPNYALACAVPLRPYVPTGAAAIVTATVTRARGRDIAAVYEVRRDAIVQKLPDAEPLQSRLTINMADHVHGTCGFDSPQLAVKDRIVLYFGISGGRLLPESWKLLHRAQ
jgi:hypothetical protein